MTMISYRYMLFAVCIRRIVSHLGYSIYLSPLLQVECGVYSIFKRNAAGIHSEMLSFRSVAVTRRKGPLFHTIC